MIIDAGIYQVNVTYADNGLNATGDFTLSINNIGFGGNMIFGNSNSNGVTTIVSLTAGSTIVLKAGSEVHLSSPGLITMTVNRIN